MSYDYDWVVYSPPYEGELVELDPFLWSEDMLGKWLGEWRGGRGGGSGRGEGGEGGADRHRWP